MNTTPPQYDTTTKVATMAALMHNAIWTCTGYVGLYTSPSPTTGTQLVACPSPIPANFIQSGDIVWMWYNGEVCTSTSAGCGATAQNSGVVLIQAQLGSTVVAPTSCDSFNISAGAGSADESREYRIVFNGTSGGADARCEGFNSAGFDSSGGVLHGTVNTGGGGCPSACAVTFTNGGSGNPGGGDNNATYTLSGTLLPAIYLNNNAPTGSTILRGFLSVVIFRP